jgi:hypothetical protein
MLDLEPIKARLAATTPGEWKWHDEFLREVPYDDATLIDDGRLRVPNGNDGSLGVTGIYAKEVISVNETIGHPVLYADDKNIHDDADWSQWRGHIQVKNVADLEFIAQAKPDIAALIAEIEWLRAGQ